MRRVLLSLISLASVAVLLLATHPGDAQVGAQVRGYVVDEEGQPLPDVTVEINYKGEGRPKAYKQKTDKQGGFVRVGLPAGPYQIVFSKEGYQKRGIDIQFSMGGLSEVPDVVMQKAEVTLSVGGEPAAKEGAEAAAARASAEEAARLGAAYEAGMESIKAGEWDAAEASLLEVLAKIPDSPQVHFNLGYVYRQKNDTDRAEAEYRRVIELQPEVSDAYVALAAAYVDSGRSDEALDLLTEAAPSFEQDAAFQVALGAIAMNSSRPVEAEAAFTKAVALDPSNVEVQFHLASLALSRNEVDDAITHLEAFLAAAPPDAPDVEVAKNLLEALQKQQ